MNQQAQLDEMKRWFVFTNQGRKITWAETLEAAKQKAERAGFTVAKVVPAPSALEAERAS